MTSQATIPNGTYILEPEGGSWVAATIRGGRMVSMTEESQSGTHAAAGDDWAGTGPKETDMEIDGDLAAAIVREVMGDDVIADMVVVTTTA